MPREPKTIVIVSAGELDGGVVGSADSEMALANIPQFLHPSPVLSLDDAIIGTFARTRVAVR